MAPITVFTTFFPSEASGGAGVPDDRRFFPQLKLKLFTQPPQYIQVTVPGSAREQRALPGFIRVACDNEIAHQRL
jgi:hypothetical protein